MGLVTTVLDSTVLKDLDQYVLGGFQVLINQMSSY